VLSSPCSGIAAPLLDVLELRWMDDVESADDDHVAAGERVLELV